VAAFVSLAIGIWQNGWEEGWIEGLSIYIAVFIIVSVTAGNNYVKEKQFQQLVAKSSVDSAAVFRGDEGRTHTIDVREMVVGDVYRIFTGMRVPADSIILHGSDLATDESSLTGEPDQVPKEEVTDHNINSNPDPFLFA